MARKVVFAFRLVADLAVGVVMVLAGVTLIVAGEAGALYLK